MNPDLGKAVQVVAHRGASGYAPETTLAAYRLALEMKADFVEMDVRMIRDASLVAFHDPDVKRTTNGKGRISGFTLAQLKNLDAGSWFNKANPEKARSEYAGLQIPTVQEIMDLVKESSAGCYVEIKDPEPNSSALGCSLLSVIRNSRMETRTRIISFSARSISTIKALDPAMPTALLLSRRLKDPVEAGLRVSADELALRFNLATPRLVETAHKAGLSVSVWTVDREPDMKRMIRFGVDRIITNYPDLLRRLLHG